jgi:hypothetical protein
VSLYQPKEGSSLHVVVIVLDGVNSVIVSDPYGTHAINVVNNVVDYEDHDPSSVSYTLPDGVVHETNLTTLANRLLNQRPGSAGSSE